ncbi:unnamed protein product [Urochloa decumbens]|uniref:Uncharacterized protein n=1 Tax=Urochloa decumbens TaxID=240449 RepID=A0ABC9ARB2_9POAL
MADTRSEMMGMVCLIAAVMFVATMYSTLLPTAYADQQEPCTTLTKKCDHTNCNKLQCKEWHGNHNFENVYCKVIVPNVQKCCCKYNARSSTLPSRQHESSLSHRHL